MAFNSWYAGLALGGLSFGFIAKSFIWTSEMVKEALPENTGCLAVGSTDLVTGVGKSGVLARLFYPSVLKVNASLLKDYKRAPIVSERLYADGIARFLKLPVWLFGKLTNWLLGGIRSHDYIDAPLLPQTEGEQSLFPVVVFSPGLGGMRTFYTTICSDLASHGFVVAMVEHRDESSAASFMINEDGTKSVIDYLRPENHNEEPFRKDQIMHRINEVKETVDVIQKLQTGDPSLTNYLATQFSVDVFKGRLNLSDISMVGHSFGGATTVGALVKDERFKCGIAMDVWMYPLPTEIYTNVTTPLLLINSDTFHWKNNVKQINDMIESSQKGIVESITIRGTSHHTTSDVPFLPDGRPLLNIMPQGTLDKERAMSIVRTALVHYLSKHIGLDFPSTKDIKSKHSVLTGGGDYPEVFQGVEVYKKEVK